VNLYFAEAGPEDQAFFASAFPDEAVTFSPAPFSVLDAPSDTEVLSVMVHSPVRREAIAAMQNLKLIATRSTGFDHIDLEAARERGIHVCTVPAYGVATVAEHTFALILALTRKVHKAYLRGLHGDTRLDDLMGIDLAGKTLGVIGAGKIGRHVIQIGKGFAMNVVAYDLFEDPAAADFRFVALNELYREADVIAVCCPLTEATDHLIDASAFAQMKKGVIFVNTARGAVVDSHALLQALEDGTVAGAGLDVLEHEEVLGEDALVASLLSKAPDSPSAVALNLALMRHPLVIVTPHMAFYSREALQRIRDTTAENIQAFQRGYPQNTV